MSRAGPDKIYLFGSGTEKSVPRRSLVQFDVFSHLYELLRNVLFLHLFQS